MSWTEAENCYKRNLSIEQHDNGKVSKGVAQDLYAAALEQHLEFSEVVSIADDYDVNELLVDMTYGVGETVLLDLLNYTFHRTEDNKKRLDVTLNMALQAQWDEKFDLWKSAVIEQYVEKQAEADY